MLTTARGSDHVPVAFGAGTLALTALLALLAWQAQRAAFGTVLHSREVQTHTAQVLSLLTDAETGQRGFLLTGAERYLQPYAIASARLPAALDELRQLTADDPVQQRAVLQLQQDGTAKLQELEATVTRARAGELGQALAIVRSDRGQRLMEGLRQRTGAIEREEQHRLALRLDRAATAQGLTLLSIAALACTAMVLLFMVRDAGARARARIRMSEERLATTLHSIGDAVIATDAQGRIERMNPTAERMTGWNLDDAKNRPLDEVFRVISETNRAPIESPVAKVMREGNVVGLANHTLLLARDGREVAIEDSGAPIRDAQGSTAGVVLVFQDASARRAAQWELELLIQRAPIGIYLVDADFRMRNVNPVAQRSFAGIAGGVEGRDLEEVLRIAWPGSFAEELMGIFRRCLESGESYECAEVGHVRADRAATEYYAWRVDRFARPEGRFALVCYFIDITAQVQARETIAESESRFHIMADNIPQLAWMADPGGHIFWFNKRWFDYTGTTLEQVAGWNWRSVYHPEHVDRVVRRLRRSFESGEPWEDTFPLRAANGSYRWFLSRALPVRDASGRIVRWFGTNTDVTEQRAQEQQLRSSHAQLRKANELLELVQQSANIGYWDWDVQGGEVNWSRQCKALYGIPADEPMSYERFLAAVTPTDRPRIDAAVQRCLNEHAPYDVEMRVALPAGERVVVSRGRACFDAAGRPVRMSGMAFDVTALRQTQQALAAGEQRYRQVLESLPLLPWSCSSEGAADYLSPQWLQYTGSRLEANLGAGWTQFLHPHDRDRFVSQWQHAVRAGEIFDTETRIRGADGRYRWFKQRAVPLRRADGRIEQWFGTSTEITDLIESRNTFEQRVLERTQQLEEANSDLQAFAHSVAHDLRAPLRNIHGYATALLEDEVEHLSGDGALYARRMAESAMRLDALIQDLLTYSRLGRAQISPERVELNAAVSRVLREMSEEIGAREARIEVQPALPTVWGHRSTLDQVLTNLLSNALKFVGSDVVPHIEVTATTEDGFVRLCISDNGIGIDPRHHRQVFGVFERLHGSERYPGTGIGLAIVKKGVERMGGTVHLDSRVGEGSRFSILLPRVSASDEEAAS